MRTIKFRCWDSGKKEIFIPDEFVFNFNTNTLCQVDRMDVDSKLTQYTNTKDANGKEIYEGDILKYKNKNYPTSSGIYLVKWIDEDCTFVCERKYPYNFLTSNIWCECKVIGNIFENLELLENK